ncbi:MAG: type II toxin-antitoxin system VapC family toxin [Thermoanaerobaculia bacterium]|nr:type II toxin-antitoxin system VapC family toxin [Thermoanaerobaculia bacterium]
MILLDTNVLSALMRAAPDQVVVEWLDAQPAESIWTTAITVFEIRFGIERLEKGRRKRALEAAFTALIAEDFAGRVVAFDMLAASAAGSIAAARQRAGRPVDIRDLEIAGIAAARGATLATRNVRHFDQLGISLVDPWST